MQAQLRKTNQPGADDSAIDRQSTDDWDTLTPMDIERPNRSRWALAGAMGLIVIAITTAAVRLEGRLWRCRCGELRIWVSDVHSEHCSQHLLDPYSLTHVLHGVGFCLSWWLVGFGRSSRLSLLLTIAAECAWEVLENWPMIIERYRSQTAALGYEGDSVVNVLGDLASCVAGWVMASKLKWQWTVSIWIAIELLLLFWIRDNLLLNVLMLILPLEGLKQWQAG
jgi:hypothetical protein